MIYESERVAALPVGDAVTARPVDHRQRLPSEDGRTPGRIGATLTLGVSAAILLPALAVLVLAVQGWRPVVIQTGSMEPTLPVGALVVARPVAADELSAGQILIMRAPDRLPVTHRIVALDRPSGLATTRGDANPAPDLDPYQLGEEELVARYVFADGGALLVAAAHPLVPTALTTVAVLLVLPALFRDTAQGIWLNRPRFRKKLDLGT